MNGLLALLAVAAGTSLGAVGRYGAEILQARWLQARDSPAIPWSTGLVNVVGSALLGVAWGLSAGPLGPVVLVVAGAGVAGGLTTYSTFALEVVQLLRARRPLAAVGYACGSIALGVAAAAAGYLATRHLAADG